MSINRVFCPECGSIRIKTPSGAVCPNGHGRLQLGVTNGELKRARRTKWAHELPVAKRVNRRYVIDGKPHKIVDFEFGSRKVPTEAVCKDGVLARVDCDRLIVRKFLLDG